ncbi:MAG TPA: DUF2203 domain-containing protein [Dehalococcoidia bacterium]|nr:DUF2203 domain-containing protein [Dehalococcoidia bacterium]
MPRLFTVEEAEALIPELTEILLELRKRSRELERIRSDLSIAARRARGNGHVAEGAPGSSRRRAEELVAEINRLHARILALGCELKGIEEGLIDFPAEREGRTVYLCWRLGEPGISWWHELDAGFAGRQPL